MPEKNKKIDEENLKKDLELFYSRADESLPSEENKREKTLQSLAARMAKTVEKTGKNVTLEPMKAYERKIIHSMLQSNPKIKTESIGEEPKRRIVISLNK